MTAEAKDHRYWFQKICFESDTNNFCSNHCLMAKRVNAVHDNKHLGSSLLIWRGLLRNWNQRSLQQLCSYGETSQCCPWQPKPWMICTDLKRSAATQKPMVSATTFFSLWSISMLSMATRAGEHRCWFEKVCFKYETNVFCNNYLLMVKHLTVVHDSQRLGWSVLI